MKKILFLEKVFLKKKKTPNLRGVELFNFSFINDLLAEGNTIYTIVHSSWKKHFDEKFHSDALMIYYYSDDSSFLKNSKNLITHLLNLKKEKLDTLFLANAGDTLVPAMLLVKAFKIAKKQVVLAHREPTKFFAFISKLVNLESVSVNKKIASTFQKIGCPVADVYYGVKNHSDFINIDIAREHEKVTFGVIGDLDNKWKGADIAIEAFKKLPEEIANKCILKLASYTKALPENLPKNIIAYNWFPYEEMVNLYTSLDVLIVPSYDEKVMRETFSQATVQGMLSGLPIIASSLDIFKEKLDDGGGFIFNTKQELQAYIIKLAGDQKLRLELGKQARETAIKRYIWDTKYFSEKYL